MIRFSPLAVAAFASTLGYTNGFVIKSTMPSMKPLQMVRVRVSVTRSFIHD